MKHRVDRYGAGRETSHQSTAALPEAWLPLSNLKQPLGSHTLPQKIPLKGKVARELPLGLA